MGVTAAPGSETQQSEQKRYSGRACSYSGRSESQRGEPIKPGSTQLFSSRRDAAEYLFCEFLRTVWVGLAMNLHPPRLSAIAWLMVFLPGLAGAAAVDLRARRLTRDPGASIGLGDPPGMPMAMSRARQVFGTAKPWQEAFRWLGIDPEKAASARYVALWITGLLFAAALVPVLIHQTA